MVFFPRDRLARNAAVSFVNLLATPESGPPFPFDFQYVFFYCCLLIIIDVKSNKTIYGSDNRKPSRWYITDMPHFAVLYQLYTTARHFALYLKCSTYYYIDKI